MMKVLENTICYKCGETIETEYKTITYHGKIKEFSFYPKGAYFFNCELDKLHCGNCDEYLEDDAEC